MVFISFFVYDLIRKWVTGNETAIIERANERARERHREAGKESMQWNCLATFNAALLWSLLNQLIHWLNDWLTDWVSEWVSDCLTEIGKQLQQRWQLCTLSLSSTHTSFVCVTSAVVVVFGDFHLTAKRKRNSTRPARSLWSLWSLLPPAAPCQVLYKKQHAPN